MAIVFSLVIPTYNEATSIGKVCQEIVSVLDKVPYDFEIIVVDDNSPDGTWKIVEDLAKQNSKIKLLRRMQERGLGSAVVSGWKVAQGEILGVLDGDLQHPPEVLEEMIRQISNHQEIDIVVASRYIAGGKILDKNPWRILKSRLAIFLGSVLIPGIFRLVKDSMSGYFVLRRKVIEGKPLAPIGYKILLEVLAVGNYRKVYELPYTFALRAGGRTKCSWKQQVISLIHFIRLAGIKNGNF